MQRAGAVICILPCLRGGARTPAVPGPCPQPLPPLLPPGIGYFTLPYLVHAAAAFAHACEWNDHAVEALRRNLVLNGVQDRCRVHHGDSRQVSGAAGRSRPVPARRPPHLPAPSSWSCAT